MNARHHVDDELLVAYAAGDLPEAIALFVATHMALCRRCLASARMWEAVGGEMLLDLEATPTEPHTLDALMRRIEAPETETVRAISSSLDAKHATDRDPLLPEPLRSYVGCRLDGIDWRWALPGLKEFILPVSLHGVPARLARLSPFFRIPRHTHTEPEYTLILSGGLQDEHGTYERADVHVYDETHTHAQRVLPGEPCICLVVNPARLVPLTWLGRTLSMVTGR